ncbi:MAG TPA: ABC transporter permease, partial [Pyrinomonadaceae bacterium]|nr:ABC transporter permease [Pyrinomonadaceae bacterium]
MDNLVFSNMLHRPARTAVSVLGIAVGVLLIVFTVGLANGTLRENASREGNVGAEIMVRASGTMGISGTDPFRLPVGHAQEIARIEGVRTAIAIGQNLVGAKDTNFGSRLVDGVNWDEYSQIAGLKLLEGRPPVSGDEAAIDTSWQQSKKIKVGQTIPVYEREFKVVGVYEPAAGARIKIPLATMQQQLGGEDKCTMILVKINDPSQVETVMGRIADKFPGEQIFQTKDLEEIYQNAIPALDVFLDV